MDGCSCGCAVVEENGACLGTFLGDVLAHALGWRVR